jgi:LPS-assembly lipoprotein
MWLTKSIIWIFLTFLISGCGFKPLYGKEVNSKSLRYLSQIEISPIQSIEGVEFYNRMSSILPSNTGSKFLLTVSLTYSSEHGIIQKNSDIIRENLKLHVRYSLISQDTRRTLTSGEFRRISSYSTIFVPYSNTVRSQDSAKNLAASAAEEIRTRLILFFENNIDETILK